MLTKTLSPRSRVTIRDVAALAGVSHQTVSRVINGNERVSQGTRQRVQTAIDELGYRPNAIARFMARGRTFTLACFSPNLTDYTFASVIEGAETEARLLGYFMLIASAPDETAFEILVDQLIASSRVEGLLVLTPFIHPYHTRLPRHIPVVFVGAQPRQAGALSVCLDEIEAGRLAANHLIEHGHRQIAHITGPMSEECSQCRLTGYHQALNSANIQTNPNLVTEGDWSATSGFQATNGLWARGERFSAIVAQNDRMAVGAIKALREAGLSIPQDVSVIGFDDMPLASYFDPPLTTIRQDTFHIGHQAARLLIRVLENNEETPEHLYLPAELVVRCSTAPYQNAP